MSTTTVAVCALIGLLFPGITAQPEYCKLPSETGPCRANIQRYYFHAGSHTCKQFTYGGCKGNGNRFNSTEDCLKNCSYPEATNILCQSAGFKDLKNQFVKAIYVGFLTVESLCKNYTQRTCNLPPETGPCRGNIPKFYYNVSTETCEEFTYGGCGGNDNKFETIVECEQTCNDTAVLKEYIDACSLPPVTGPCKARFPRFFYNSTSGQCEEFIYGGCQGNDNRFETKQRCETNCSTPPTTPARIDTCLQPPESGPCLALFRKFYYNASTEMCEEFNYGGCQGNDNRFDTQEFCERVCIGTETYQTPNTTCLLAPETGPCKARFPRFFYNSTSEKCEEFIYGGCRGNDNRFETTQDCENKCNGTSTPQPPIDVCLLPSETGPCEAIMPKFFYNSTSGKCEGFIYGGCQGNGNKFETQEDCYSKCEYPVPENACNFPPDMGPCDGDFQKYFYNKTADACQLFTYGGCQGNNNRFDCKLDCEQTCGCSAH